MKQERIDKAVERLEELAMIEAEREGLRNRTPGEKLEHDRLIAVAREPKPPLAQDFMIQQHFEIAVLRELVRDCRTYIAARKCDCYRYNEEFCEKCAMLARIDGDLDAIGKERENATD
jgi:hypothetical protein